MSVENKIVILTKDICAMMFETKHHAQLQSASTNRLYLVIASSKTTNSSLSITD